MGFRSYIDTQLTDALKISRVVASLSDSESDDEANATIRLEADEGLRRKLRKFPDAKHPGNRAPPSDIHVGLAVSLGIQYLGFRAGILPGKREGCRSGSGARTPADLFYCVKL